MQVRRMRFRRMLTQYRRSRLGPSRVGSKAYQPHILSHWTVHDWKPWRASRSRKIVESQRSRRVNACFSQEIPLNFSCLINESIFLHAELQQNVAGPEFLLSRWVRKMGIQVMWFFGGGCPWNLIGINAIYNPSRDFKSVFFHFSWILGFYQDLRRSKFCGIDFGKAKILTRTTL